MCYFSKPLVVFGALRVDADTRWEHRTPVCSVSPSQELFSISRSPGPPRFMLGCHFGDNCAEACRGVLTIRKAEIVDSTYIVDLNFFGATFPPDACERS